MEDLRHVPKETDTVLPPDDYTGPEPTEEELEKLTMELTEGVTKKAAEEVNADVFDAEGKPTVEFTEAFIRLFAKELGIDERIIRQEIAAELGVPPDEVIGAMIAYNEKITNVVDPASGDNQLDLFVTRDEDVQEAIDITDEFPIPERTIATEPGSSDSDVPSVL